MSHLGELLDLPEGSRLTGITLRPGAEWWALVATTAHLQVVTLPDVAEPSARAEALAVFLPDTYAVLHGTTPAGAAWIAVLQLTTGDPQQQSTNTAALTPLRRAMGLLGLDGDVRDNLPMTRNGLVSAYRRAGVDVGDDWALTDLLLGLLVELTGVPREEVAPFADHPADGEGPAAEGRSARLISLLESWSSRSDGPVG